MGNDGSPTLSHCHYGSMGGASLTGRLSRSLKAFSRKVARTLTFGGEGNGSAVAPMATGPQQLGYAISPLAGMGRPTM